MKQLLAFLNRHPWIYVVLAFGILIAGWSTLISIAFNNPVEKIEIEPVR